jgi:oxygen-dependent protoporphyrinogen oxidase
VSDISDVVVIGGGFSGLFIAAQLARDGKDVLLLESSDRPGGVARTVVDDGYVLEPAAGTFMLPHRALAPILESAGVRFEEAYPSAGMRYVWLPEGLTAIEYGPKALATKAISRRGKLRMAAEPFVRVNAGADEESLKGFLTRRLGHEAGSLLSHVAASGVYAGDAEQMSAASTFPLFTEMEAEFGSVVRGAIRRVRSLPKPRPAKPTSHVPIGGMSAAAETLAASLGERYRDRFGVTSVTREDSGFRIEGPEVLRARSVVVALRPDEAAGILPGVDSAVLENWPSSPVAVVGIGGTTEEVPLPDGFGFLTGPDVDATTLGCLFESSFGPGRVSEGRSLAKVIVGGTKTPEVVDWADDQIIDAVVGDMERALKVAVTPSWTRVVRNRSGIPQYDLKHRARMTAVSELERTNPGLLLAGWAYRGVGLAHLATEAVRISTHIR